MFKSRTSSLSDEALAAVRGYESRIQELLDSCADHQRHDPEVFLWNARRALEAMCHLLITVQSKSPSSASGTSKDHSLDSMIQRLKKENVLDREQAPRFELARSHTNLGVHIQQSYREDYSAAVDDTAHVLPGLIDWLYAESIARPHLGTIARLPHQIIREGGREGPSIKEKATKAEMTEREMERTSSLLRNALDERTAALRERETRWWGWFGRVAVVSSLTFAVGLCMGVGGASWLQPGTKSSRASTASMTQAASAAEAEPAPPLAAPTTAASPQAEVMVTPEAPAAASPPPTDVAPPAPPAEPTCPTGMTYVPAITKMRLGQPVGGRKNWPRPKAGRLEPVDVPAFCLDTTPRFRNVVAPAAYDEDSVSKCERFRPEKDAPLERTCLSRDEAERICATSAPNGHLPTLIEWESAVRAKVTGLQQPEHEWTGERFPPAVLRRIDPDWDRGDGMWVGQIKEKRKPKTEDSALLLAWNQQAPDNRHPERGFRCAASPE